MAVPRISALLMLRSTISTVSAPATCLFRGSITNPTQLLCTLRGRRYRRLTQHLLPGGPLRAYPAQAATMRFQDLLRDPVVLENLLNRSVQSGKVHPRRLGAVLHLR